MLLVLSIPLLLQMQFFDSMLLTFFSIISESTEKKDKVIAMILFQRYQNIPILSFKTKFEYILKLAITNHSASICVVPLYVHLSTQCCPFVRKLHDLIPEWSYFIVCSVIVVPNFHKIILCQGFFQIDTRSSSLVVHFPLVFSPNN